MSQWELGLGRCIRHTCAETDLQEHVSGQLHVLTVRSRTSALERRLK